jgi:pyridinium-3,5-biscarboxylic acid mononucleotide synthase
MNPSSRFPESDNTPEVRVDLDRAGRCGFPEVIFATGKTTAAIVAAFETLLKAKQSCLATRCTPEQAEGIRTAFPQAVHNAVARTVRLNADSGPESSAPPRPVGRVVVVTAGTSDRPVAEEALETLRWMNVETELLMDVGVAGPQRFLDQKHRLAGADVVIVVAGMEGALPSVVAGWLDCPVIAVPTSIGYGASFNGITALLGMLNSCAANVAVVNIDAGFKAGYLAGLMTHRIHRRSAEVRADEPPHVDPPRK